MIKMTTITEPFGEAARSPHSWLDHWCKMIGEPGSTEVVRPRYYGGYGTSTGHMRMKEGGGYEIVREVKDGGTVRSMEVLAMVRPKRSKGREKSWTVELGTHPYTLAVLEALEDVRKRFGMKMQYSR